MNGEQRAAVFRLYAESQGITIASLATYLTSNACYFDRLAVGRVTLRTAEKAAMRLSEIRPADLPWPDDIPRPASHDEDRRGEAA